MGPCALAGLGCLPIRWSLWALLLTGRWVKSNLSIIRDARMSGPACLAAARPSGLFYTKLWTFQFMKWCMKHYLLCRQAGNVVLRNGMWVSLDFAEAPPLCLPKTLSPILFILNTLDFSSLVGVQHSFVFFIDMSGPVAFYEAHSFASEIKIMSYFVYRSICEVVPFSRIWCHFFVARVYATLQPTVRLGLSGPLQSIFCRLASRTKLWNARKSMGTLSCDQYFVF